MASRNILHDLGAFSMLSSDFQAMGRVGVVIVRTWQTAHKMKVQRGALRGDPAANYWSANTRGSCRWPNAIFFSNDRDRGNTYPPGADHWRNHLVALRTAPAEPLQRDSRRERISDR